MSTLREAARGVLAAYQEYLDTDNLDVLRDSLTGLQDALGESGDPASRRQYRVTYRGRQVWTATEPNAHHNCERYIDGGVAGGRRRDDYRIETRTVTTEPSPWKDANQLTPTSA